jgi:hypothetical protein
VHRIKENHDVPKGKTMMECGEFIFSTTEGGNFVESNFLESEMKSEMWKVQRKNINKFVLDTVIELVGKVERRPRQMWII